jgi:spermidine/putrescine-binding protein
MPRSIRFPAILPLVAGLALMLAACGKEEATTAAAPPPTEEDKLLHIYNWSDYIAPDTITNFEKETGIPNVYPTAEMRARLVPDKVRSPEYSRLLNRVWTALKTGQ